MPEVAPRKPCKICGKWTRYKDEICQTCRKTHIDPPPTDPNDIPAGADIPKQKINFKEMFIMNRNTISKILVGLILVVLAAVFFKLLPFLGALETGRILLAGIAFIFVGTLAALISMCMVTDKNSKELRLIKNIGIALGAAIILFVLIIGIKIPLVDNNLLDTSANPQNQVVSNETNEVKPVTSATTTTANAGIAPIINEGANFGTNEKVLVQAGDVVSGDIQIINSDGTRESLYDDKDDTALITIFTDDTWIIGPFGNGVGGYLAKQATQAKTDEMIADKQQSLDNFREVIVKTWPSGTVVSYPGNSIK